MSQGRGQLAIVLHTHMPYVESFGTWPFGEEWLWRATAESYLRLEDTLARHPLTVGLTPVLADQFEAVKSAAGDRMLDFFRDSREHVFAEDMRSFHEVGEGEMSIALAPQLEDYRRAAARFEELDRDMSRVFAGAAELLAGPATHPIMPLVATDFGRDLQLQTGIDSHRSRFGDWNGGLWLSECAYAPGVERSLERAGVSHFCVDQSRVYGKDSLDNLEPVAAGETVAVPIDWKTVELIWTAQGYPVAAPYRSTFDLTIHSLMPRRNGGGPHDPAEARAQAASDAGDFLRRVRVRLDEYAAQRGRPGTCVVAIDTELLGHWWYEGPWWLEEVCSQAASAGVDLTTLGDALKNVEPVERKLATSTWGEHKDLSTWDSPTAADLVWQQRDAELRLVDALEADTAAAASPAALRAARELLMLQSSDWAFIEKRQTAGDYGRQRFAAHLAEFDRALTAMSQSDAGSGEGIAAETAGLAPLLTNERLAKISCGH